MRDNLRYYLSKGAKEEDLVNREAAGFVLFYSAGVKAYRAMQWPAVIQRMEKAVLSYLDDEERCRFACEKPFDMGWHPDFVSSVASNEPVIYQF